MAKDSVVPELLKEFDIKKYDACKEWDANDWCLALSERAEMRHFFRTANGKVGINLTTRQVMKGEREFFLKVAEDRIKNPMSASTGVKTSAPCVLRDFKLTDILHTDEVAGRASWLTDRSLTFRDVAMMVEMPTMFYIAIDLNAPDAIIQEKFSHWLKQVRSETGIAPRHSAPKGKSFDFQGWHSQRLLPYLDIVFCSKLGGLAVKDDVMGKLLFPRGLEDTRGKLRSLPKNALKMISRENVEELARLCQFY